MAITLITSDAPFNPDALLPIRWGSQGETEAFLRDVLASLENVGDFKRFALTAPQSTALRNACAKVAGLTKDQTKDKTQVAIVKDGKTTWKFLRKDESAGRRETRTVKVRSYSKDARMAGVQAIRDIFGVALNEDPTVSSPNVGETVYALHKVATVS
jgi:hypothetical protein